MIFESLPLWLVYVFRIALFFLIAWLVHQLGKRIAPRIARISAWQRKTGKPRPERRDTLTGLIAGMIAAMAYLAAVLASLRIYVDSATLVWLVGLFAAGFGLSARPLISDFLSGVSFLFEDTFAVGEKVELGGVEGAIERVFLRTTHVRASTGELYIIPNGEIRLVRNFSRGRFSVAEIQIKISADQLNKAIQHLAELGEEAVSRLPNLLEPWQVISKSGAIGQHTVLTLIAHSRFGQAGEMRPKLLTLVRERLEEAGIPLVD